MLLGCGDYEESNCFCFSFSLDHLQDGISDLFCLFLSLESIKKHAKDYYMGVGMMILVISVAFALAALRISALRSPPVVPELMMVEFIPKRNDKI